MFFGNKLMKYQASVDDLLNLWCFYSITAPHYANHSIYSYRTTDRFFCNFDFLLFVVCERLGSKSMN